MIRTRHLFFSAIVGAGLAAGCGDDDTKSNTDTAVQDTAVQDTTVEDTSVPQDTNVPTDTVTTDTGLDTSVATETTRSVFPLVSPLRHNDFRDRE